MLFVESKTLSHETDGPRRINLLEELQKKNLIPLIRAVRLKCFDHVLLSPERIGEMETAMATWTEDEDREAYVRGDVFCLSDHVFYLIFNDDKSGGPVIRAGIIYEARTSEPFRKLDSFCRDVREFLRESQPGEVEKDEVFPEWEQGKPSVPNGFKRFVAKQDTDSLYTSLRRETMVERIRAASMLEDPSARIFLRHAKEANVEGYAARLLTGDTAEYYETSIERLEGAGLIEPEVQVSCRETGHALFRLPTADALAVVTVSDARCSECGSAVADEKVEEVFVPTRLAASLLENGSWLITRLHFLLREMGIPVKEIALGTSGAEGYGQMMANICGESFLLLARDGDLTPAFARWAIDLELETEASHLVVVATGRIHNQAELLLRNHARRRVLAGHDFELILADEAAVASKELQDAFERVSQRVIAEQMCDLDNNIGLSISRIIITKFKLLRKTEGLAPQNPSRASVPSVSSPTPHLTMAAHASAHAAEILDLDEVMPDQPPDNPEGGSILSNGPV